MRSSVPYAERQAIPTREIAGAIDIAVPTAGFYKLKLSRDMVLRALRIWHGPPADPVTGEPLDRSWRWQAELDDGALIDFDRVWPACARNPIAEAEWKRCRARTAWAREHAPDSAYADRTRRLDPLDARQPLPF